MNKTEKMILFYVALFCATLVLISIFWRSNPYYSKAYTPIVEKSNAERAIVEQNRIREAESGNNSGKKSEQPMPSGFREQDIDKKTGDRFSTY
jgi:type II secretory pathway component PulC